MKVTDAQDTMASRTSAKSDETADNSIGNITGSLSTAAACAAVTRVACSVPQQESPLRGFEVGCFNMRLIGHWLAR